jgi:putative DNA primase/helicase
MLNAIRSAGYSAPNSIIADGKIHRFATNSTKKHSQDGWYVSFGEVGSFGSWRDGLTNVWSSGNGSQITQEQREFIEREKQRAMEQAKAEAKATGERARRLYQQASETGVSEYLNRKGISKPHGAKFLNLDSTAFGFEKSFQLDCMVIPLFDKKGELHTLQLITNDRKFFMKNGRTGGMFHVLGTLDGATVVIIAEGIATAQSIFEATGHPVVVAFSASNLSGVAQTIREKCGAAKIIVAADNDEIGIRKAKEASQFVKADVVIPEIKGDFNDLRDLELIASYFPEVDNDLWRAELIMKHKSNGDSEVANRTQNLITILENAPEFKGRVALNTFSGQICVDKKDVIESTAIKLKATIEKNYVPEKVSTNDVIEAMHVVAENNSHHPIKEYLDGLTWDGTGRICTTLLIEMGLPITKFNQSAIRYFFISAVKRIFEPACKVDMMLILESVQGLGKSTFFKVLFMEWYAEITSSLNDKDFFMGLRGVWCADFGELDQFNKADSTRIKQVITMTDDHYRPAYARLAQKFPRQCIFVGGTNRDDWQKDETGGRRFLPIKITRIINNDWVQENRDQLWAEAVHLMSTVKDWWNVTNASEEQEARYEGDSWEEIVAHYIFSKTETSITDILLNALKIEIGKHSKSEQYRIGKIMSRQKNWVKKQVSGGARKYVKITT